MSLQLFADDNIILAPTTVHPPKSNYSINYLSHKLILNIFVKY